MAEVVGCAGLEDDGIVDVEIASRYLMVSSINRAKIGFSIACEAYEKRAIYD